MLEQILNIITACIAIVGFSICSYYLYKSTTLVNKKDWKN